MPRWLPYAFAAAAGAMAIWLFIDNRSLRDQLASRHPAVAGSAAPGAGSAGSDDGSEPARDALHPRSAAVHVGAPIPPTLPDVKEESRLDRRARRQNEIAAMLGRGSGESDEDYHARIVPLIAAGLAVPRVRVAEMRKEAEDKAHVTPQQSQALDHAFDKVYGDVLDYTNKAVADGELSPYERNVAGWLDYAGGLGGLMNEANGQIGQILSPDQIKTMSDSGFEWAEYLGTQAPWEKLAPPPPPR